jgi:hypothetical protein
VPEILVLADEDDVGISRLVTRLERRREVRWWRFGTAEADVEADVGTDDFCLRQADVTLRSDDFASADVVICKRRWLQPRPLVRSGLDGLADRRFSEREWQSLLDGVLLDQESRCDATWLNAPSAWARTANKLSLLLRAVRKGIPVPPFRISTPIQPPANGGGGDVVAKAISADEEIEPARHFSTVRLSAAEVGDLSGRRVATPSLLQAHVRAVHELRAYSILGKMVTLRLRPSARHVDIRHSTREEMDPRFDRLPGSLEAALTALTRELGLGYCAFDLIAGEDGEIGLVDITPAGSWDHFETAGEPAVSDAFAEIVENHVRARRGGPR